jgi:hypothetical protein
VRGLCCWSRKVWYDHCKIVVVIVSKINGFRVQIHTTTHTISLSKWNGTRFMLAFRPNPWLHHGQILLFRWTCTWALMARTDTGTLAVCNRLTDP